MKLNKNILELKIRKEIHKFISKNPGSNKRKISRRMKIPLTTLLVISFFVNIISLSFTPVTVEAIDKNNIEFLEKYGEISNNFDTDQKINDFMKYYHVPSLSVCIVKNNNIVLCKGYGYYDIKNLKPVENDTIYPIGSVTKLITATAIMQLIENESYGLNLDDTVSKYLGLNLKNPKYTDINITFRMLLTHQSSLAEPFFSFCNYFSLFGYSHE